MKPHLFLALVVTVALVLIVTACSGIVVTKTVTLPSTTKTTTVSAPTKTIVQTQTITVTLPPEPIIPSGFSTYTEENLFSISYPSTWEPALSVIEELKNWIDELILNINSSLPVDEVRIVFIAGVPMASGWSPNVNIVIEPSNNMSHDDFVDATINAAKYYFEDYKEFYRNKITIDGKEATIYSFEGTIPVFGKTRVLQMILIANNNVWGVTCTPPLGEFSVWEQDFLKIVKSFRLLN